MFAYVMWWLLDWVLTYRFVIPVPVPPLGLALYIAYTKRAQVSITSEALKGPPIDKDSGERTELKWADIDIEVTCGDTELSCIRGTDGRFITLSKFFYWREDRQGIVSIVEQLTRDAMSDDSTVIGRSKVVGGCSCPGTLEEP